MGTKKILFFACLWLVTIGNAQVIRGYDYCHDTLAQRINIRKVARYVKIWEKYYREEVTEKQQNDLWIHDLLLSVCAQFILRIILANLTL